MKIRETLSLDTDYQHCSSCCFFCIFFLLRSLLCRAFCPGVASSFMFSLVTYYFDIFIRFIRIDAYSNNSLAEWLFLISSIWSIRYLSSAVKPQLLLKLLHTQLIFQKSSPKFSRTYRVDVPHTVAENDLRSLLYLVRLFEKISPHSR